MSDDIDKIDNKIVELQKQKKEKIKEQRDLKIQALGAGIMKAVKAGHLSWDDLRPALQKSVTGKKNRVLLDLGEIPPPIPNHIPQNY